MLISCGARLVVLVLIEYHQPRVHASNCKALGLRDAIRSSEELSRLPPNAYALRYIPLMLVASLTYS